MNPSRLEDKLIPLGPVYPLDPSIIEAARRYVTRRLDGSDRVTVLDALGLA